MSRRARMHATVAAILVLTLAVSAFAEVCKGNKVPKPLLAQYDADVLRFDQDQTARETALGTHLPWGQPRCPRLLPLPAYIVCYDADERTALWVAYRLTREDVVSATRLEAFRTDPRLTDQDSAHCADYARSGFDRGHIVPRDDMNRTPATQADTFFLSNMAPQTPALNRGMWRWLEERVREYAKQYGEVSVLAGAVFQDVRTVPSGNVGIPSRFYKIVIRRDGDSMAVLAFLLPNELRGLPVPPGTRGVQGRRVSGEAADAYLTRNLVSIARIEHLIGVDLLPNIDRDDLKRAVASELWPRN